MAGINGLDEIFRKKGEDFIKKLLNLKVKITEKISANKFSFEYQKGIFVFFKRQTDSPITKIDRLLMKLYEEPINYFEHLPNKIKQQIPSKWRFNFEYFNSNSPLNYISYDHLPLNKLILTHIIKPNGEVIDTKEVLNKWSSLLEVSGPPIIFEGFLTPIQKDEILTYLRNSKEVNMTKYETESFTKFLITLLNPTLQNSTLNDSLDNKIEGVVFSFDNKGNQIFAKLIDPVLDNLIKNNKRAEEKNDTLPIIFSDMIEFMEKETFWRKMRLRKSEIDERYIELMSKMFNKFIKEYGSNYENMSLIIPNFLKKPEFDINVRFIDNSETLRLINLTNQNKELFKIFIALFKRKKKKIEEFLVPTVIKYQNNLVDEIFSKIITPPIKESGLMTFEQFINYFSSPEDYQHTKYQKELSELNEVINDDNYDSINESNTMKLVGFWQKAFPPKYENTEEIKPKNTNKNITIVIGNFQPIHEGHINSCKKIYEFNKNKLFLVQLNQNKSSENKPFGNEFSQKMLEKVIANEKMFIGYNIVEKNQLNKILDNLSTQYNPTLVLVDNKNTTFYRKQIEFGINEGTIDNKLELMEFSPYIKDNKTITSKDLRQYLQEDNYLEFKKHVPMYIKEMYEEMKEEMKKIKEI